MRIELQLGHKTVAIQIKRGLFREVSRWATRIDGARRAMILTDDNVDRLYGTELAAGLEETGLSVHRMSIAPGEASKSLETVQEVFSRMLKAGMDRNDLLVLLGGGVVGDLGGFCAATYMRGIRYVQIPTSLLAQVDSSVGGKVGVNLPQGKNLCGSFYHPESVWIDPELLETLPPQEFRSGMAEVIKYGCIGDERLFALIESYYDGRHEDPSLLTEMIGRSVAQKVEVVAADEREGGRRKLLNFGHTLGHAVEKTAGYGNISHGEAVAIGMSSFTHAFERMGKTGGHTAERLDELLRAVGLPTDVPAGLDPDDLMDAMLHDKKMSGETIAIILIKRIGHGFIQQIGRDELPDYMGGGAGRAS